MRIAWRWLLPVVPLVLLASVWHDARAREAEIRGMRQQHLQIGETYRCEMLWASREAYKDDREWRRRNQDAIGWMSECWPPLHTALANLANFPGVAAGFATSVILLLRFDIPMMPTFYLSAALISFIFWYAIGDWIERRRRSTSRKST